MSRPWTVLKFGGTSVSTAAGWDVIASRIRGLRPDSRVWIVASAFSQVSDRLERAIEESRSGERSTSLDWVVARHRSLARDLGLATAGPEVDRLHADLERWLEGVRLTGEVSPRLRARVLATGELVSTAIGREALTVRGLEVVRVDARDLLVAPRRPGEGDESRYLAASLDLDPDPRACDRAAGGGDVVLTQGFIARTSRGETCLLGRGGSDTSASWFARLLGAERIEIWTDVHGMFTADPRVIPTARLIRRIGYREARELASMGAKVLHPGCLTPVERSDIPLEIRNTFDPERRGTEITGDESEPVVTAVSCRTGVTLLGLSTPTMWGTSGFLSRAFEPFERLDVSVDLVATSQSAVTVTLDRVPGGFGGETFEALVAALRRLGTVDVVHPCAVVSIVGTRIRSVLHEVAPALSVFRERRVHLVSESSEDLNLSFVVDESDVRPLLREVHARLFPAGEPTDPGARFGETWEMLAGSSRRSPSVRATAEPTAWWRRRRDDLLRAVEDGLPRYVYDLCTVRERCAALRSSVRSVDRWFYSIKANPHPEILRAVAGAGFGMECVSIDEVRHVRTHLGDAVPVLFTPNFCPGREYGEALAAGAEVTVDGPEPLAEHGSTFRGVDLAVRLDPGTGRGHHEKVRTAGAESKFGHPVGDLDPLVEAVSRCGARVVGIHAHVGSGIRDAVAWRDVLDTLAVAVVRFPDVRWIDVGGGIGVVERPGQEPVDLRALDAAIAEARRDVPVGEVRMEPGRFVVAEAGVLLAPVTQVRTKNGVRFVGVATGMNSLLRPALYGAWHAIHNLSRIDDPPRGVAHVVGPICESGDVLGRARALPETSPGDVLLIETCGAYGATMASRYNLREPAGEAVLDGPATS